MNPKTKNLLVRTAAGIVYVALMVAGTFCPPLMCVLMAAVSGLAIYEFGNLTSTPTGIFTRILMTVAAIVTQFCLLFEYYNEGGGYLYDGKASVVIIFYVLVLASIFLLAAVFSLRELISPQTNPIERISTGLGGTLWIVCPLAAITTLSFIRPSDALALFILIWSYDTFAYLGGTLLGKHKMCPHISPGKTWEGTIIGCVMTLVLAWFLPLIPYFGAMRGNHWEWILFALIIVVFGTCGDLVESLFKRNAGVKDSGNIMPGHGGILDRFDSLLFAAIPTLIYITILFIDAPL